MRTKYLLSGTAITAIAAALVLNANLGEDSDRAYSSKDSDRLVTGSKGAYEYFLETNRNTETGQIEPGDLKRALDFANFTAAQSVYRVSSLNWMEEGPDNIGGRTRAILVDRNDRNHLFAGSVTGGLFVSFSRGNTWQKVDGFTENLSVASMAQTPNGDIYVATGLYYAFNEDWAGSGLYRSTDNGVTWNVVPGTENWDYINEIRASDVNNTLWIAHTSGAGGGLYTFDGSNLSIVSATGLVSGSVKAMDASSDGQVIVCHVSSSTYVSRDGGASFTNESSGTNPNPSNAGRNEYAISHDKANGSYKIYCSQASTGANYGKLKGVYISEDSGQEWYEIAPGWQGGTPSFQPFSTSLSAQGNYDNIIGVAPGNPDRAFIGGIDIYRWDKGASNPPFGQFEQISVWFASPTSSTYAHADQHEMVWDDWGRLYVGNDGGVHRTDDQGDTWLHMNRGYNVTQFYSVAYSAHGDVMGGAQDNGTLHNDHANGTWKEFTEVRGGDGFDCDISFYNRDLMVSSVYYTSIARSSDRGATWSTTGMTPQHPFETYSRGSVGTTMGPFHTVMRLGERNDDFNSTDTILMPVYGNYSAGSVVPVPGYNSGDTLYYTTSVDLMYDDTVCYDPGLTQVDTAITDQETGNVYYLGGANFNWLTGGADSSITVGDSIRIQIIGANYDTVEVGSVFTYNHYFAYNAVKNKTFDMGSDSCIYTGVPWDTIHVQDPHQSWFAVAMQRNNGSDQRCGVLITRDVKRFATTSMRWNLVADSMQMGGGSITCLEFSADLEHLYVGTSRGQVWRISNFNNVYSSTPDDVADSLIGGWNSHTIPSLNHAPYQATKYLLYQDGANRKIGGIGVNPSDADHIVIAIANSNGTGHVREFLNAATANDTIGVVSSDISGGLPTDLAVYDAVIDRNDPSQIVIGTYTGVFVTDNGGATWTNASGGFGNVPVYSVRQDWRTFSEGSYKPGTIYIGTFGRGIWSSTDLLGNKNPQTGMDEKDKMDLLQAFPNPSNDITNLRFNLDAQSDVQIRVFNVMGGLMKTVRKGIMSEGRNEISLDVSDLPVGTYLIQLRAGEQTEVAKFIRAM